jgi:tetratricopeptide (TPR) repeat protein
MASSRPRPESRTVSAAMSRPRSNCEPRLLPRGTSRSASARGGAARGRSATWRPDVDGSVAAAVGQLEADAGNPDAAADLYQRSLTYEEQSHTLNSLGRLRLLEDDYEGALEWLKQSAALSRAQGHEWAHAQDLIALAYALHGLGRDDEATSLLRESLELLGRLKEVRVSTNCFDALSATLAADKSEIAAALISAAEILRVEGGITTGSLSQKWNPVTWETLRSRLSENSLARSIERGRGMDIETAVAFALASTD